MMVKKYGCGKLLQVVKKVVKFQKVESLTHQHYNDSHTSVTGNNKTTVYSFNSHMRYCSINNNSSVISKFSKLWSL